MRKSNTRLSAIQLSARTHFCLTSVRSCRSRTTATNAGMQYLCANTSPSRLAAILRVPQSARLSTSTSLRSTSSLISCGVNSRSARGLRERESRSARKARLELAASHTLNNNVVSKPSVNEWFFVRFMASPCPCGL